MNRLQKLPYVGIVISERVCVFGFGMRDLVLCGSDKLFNAIGLYLLPHMPRKRVGPNEKLDKLIRTFFARRYPNYAAWVCVLWIACEWLVTERVALTSKRRTLKRKSGA